MFLVLLRYERPLAEIDRLMPDHVAFLEKGFEQGLFLLAGRRDPREGGVILARAPSAEALAGLMELDPFVREGVASFEILSFRSSLHRPELAPFADPGTRPVG